MEGLLAAVAVSEDLLVVADTTKEEELVDTAVTAEASMSVAEDSEVIEEASMALLEDPWR